MSAARTSTDLLARAFRRFEQTAHCLEERHGLLRAKIERLERRLGDADRRLEAVIEALDTGIAVVGPDGRLLRANGAFEALGLGRPGEPLGDDSVAGLLDSVPDVAGTVRLRRETAAGRRELTATVFPVGDDEGTRVLSVQDITEIRREEEEGGRRQRLEALGRMAAELAHEVRNPLGSIRLFASMLYDDLERQESQREMAEQILAAAAGLEATVSNLLAFASASARVESAPVDLTRIATDVCSLLAPACSLRRVRLEGPRGSVPCAVRGDREGLRQVVLNLVGNALSACEPGDRVGVSVRCDDQRTVLAVEDSGCGILSEDLPRVFDPFFSRTDGGTGLGLSIVHGIVERHGGRVRLDSRPGCGTRATVELPRQAERCDA